MHRGILRFASRRHILTSQHTHSLGNTLGRANIRIPQQQQVRSFSLAPNRRDLILSHGNNHNHPHIFQRSQTKLLKFPVNSGRYQSRNVTAEPLRRHQEKLGLPRKLWTPRLPGELLPHLSELHKKAEEGDPEALFELGTLHLFGGGKEVDKDETKAVELVQKSADKEWPNAQYLLSRFYLKDQFGPLTLDLSKAVEWCRKAANQGLTSAQLAMANHFMTGEGVERDPQEAVKWVQKAADGHDAQARWQLAMFYLEGELVPRDDEKGAELMALAAKDGYPEAVAGYAMCLLSGKGVEKDPAKAVEFLKGHDKNPLALMLLAQIHLHGHENYPANIPMGLEYAKRGSDTGYPDAKHAWATVLRSGEYGNKDLKTAFQLLKENAEKNHVLSMNDYGMMLKEGVPGLVEPDLEKAAEWWKKGAELNSPDCHINLSGYYSEKGDYKKSVVHLEAAAEQHHPIAMMNLGILYSIGGRGKSVDLKKAEELLTKAAQLGIIEAEVNLAMCLMKKNPPDIQKAVFWLRRAEQQGFPKAAELLKMVKDFGQQYAEQQRRGRQGPEWDPSKLVIPRGT